MSYKIKTDMFEGPLDLLVYLIENAKMDIYDIEISEITGQYIEYIKQMQNLDVEIGAEFILLAANLLKIKSKLLLPGNNKEESLKVFTTRPDTLFGATFIVVAPEHDVLKTVPTEFKNEVDAYVKASLKRSEIERMSDSKDKTGVFTGLMAINPVNGKKIPVWTSDYVLSGYGTGAIMAVPAHDDRDYSFAKKFDLPIVEVIEKPEDYKEA